jgi:hypothetical protein
MHFFLDSDTLMKKCTNMKRFINLIDLSYWEGQCCGSMIDWYGSGSGSADPCLYLIDPDPAIFVIDLQDANKKLIKKSFPAYYFLKVYLHNFSKIKSHKESQKSRNQGFSYYFCMMIEGSGVGSGSIPLTNGSGSGRPKNVWIRNTATGDQRSITGNTFYLEP